MSDKVKIDVQSDIFQVVDNGKRQEIRAALMNPDIPLGKVEESSGDTLMFKILTQVTNGDKLVLEKLDAAIGTTNDNPDSEEHAVLIDQKTLVDKDPRSLVLMNNLLSLPRDFTQEILDHPVLTTFIKRKWPRFMFFVMTTIYFLFVLTFTIFLLFMFTTKGAKDDDGAQDDDFLSKAFGKACSKDDKTTCRQNHGLNNTCNRACFREAAFQSCSDDDPWMCVSEVVFIISTIILAFQEVWQLMALKIDYLRELENYFELSIIALAVLTFFWNGIVSSQSCIAAVAVGLGWFEMIMMTGRLPNDGGLFNIMFYASTKRILKMALGLFFLVLGFGFSFYILHFDLSDTVSSFKEIPKSLASSFSWILDGADVESLYDASAEAKQNKEIVEVIAMVLVVAMMILGSLILINLVVAIIIFDFDKLSTIARETSLRNQAHHAVQIRAGINSVKWFLSCCVRDRPDEESWRQLEIIACVHSVCNCPHKKLDQETHEKVMKILKLE